MKPPRMTNFEQLKRPKTNRDDAVRPNYVSSVTHVNSMLLNSQRDYPKDYPQSIEAGGLATASSIGEPVQMNSSRENANHMRSMDGQQDAAQIYRTDFKGKLPSHAAISQQWGLRHKNLATHQQRLTGFVSSQNQSLKQNLNTTQSTPSQVSKRFAGGFGGAGSIYTHSHVTNTRKLSHYRVN